MGWGFEIWGLRLGFSLWVRGSLFGVQVQGLGLGFGLGVRGSKFGVQGLGVGIWVQGWVRVIVLWFRFGLWVGVRGSG